MMGDLNCVWCGKPVAYGITPRMLQLVTGVHIDYRGWFCTWDCALAMHARLVEQANTKPKSDAPPS